MEQINTFICKYCGKECKNQNSLTQHEIRCKQNPNKIECYGNKGNMPKHTKAYGKSLLTMRNGDKIDITKQQLDEYKEEHKVCEICGKEVNISLCIDHDHITKKFRGLLCSCCNRQLGWYEKYSENILVYLNKVRW